MHHLMSDHNPRGCPRCGRTLAAVTAAVITFCNCVAVRDHDPETREMSTRPAFYEPVQSMLTTGSSTLSAGAYGQSSASADLTTGRHP